MGARLLAIDDADQNLTLIELYLQDTEFEVVTARSGPEGLERVRQEEFDLILLDVVMPRMDGFEVCERLKKDPRTKEIPVIFLTGQMQAESQKLHAFEIGAVDYLSKPVHGEELIARIRAMLRMRESSSKLERENIELVQELQQIRGRFDSLHDEVQDLRALASDRLGSRDMLVAIDDSGCIRQCDGRFATWLAGRLGVDAERVVGRALPELWTCATAPASTGEVELAVSGGVANLEYERLSIPGASRNVVVLGLRDATRERAIRRSIEGRETVERELASPAAAAGYRMSGTIGDSPEMREVAARVDRLRNVRTPVLIHGETGTGKELVARALHFDGRFKSRKFIPIHCGAISPNLIEAELFGHERGAFTGAEVASKGLFTAADGGTVFLDEIAETSPDLQIKLLRVLQLGEVRPVGSTHSQNVDVRFIAATNGDLTRGVREGWFRADLYHRLNVVTIHLPPLRERVGDIMPLALHFLEQVSKRQDLRAPNGFSRAAARRLEDYPWPGNVRELENVIQGVLSLGCGDVVQEADLPDHVRRCRPPDLERDSVGLRSPVEIPRRSAESAEREREPTIRESEGIPDLRKRRNRIEYEAMREALDQCDGDKQRAAEALGMSRSTFYRKLREYGN